MKEVYYVPNGYKIKYVDSKNIYMKKAKEVAEKFSKDTKHKTGAVIVKSNKIIGYGANGSDFHLKIGCIRKWINASTGKLYFLCSGCSPRNHAEQKAIQDAKISKKNPEGSDLYLYGHWWCCHSCWDKMIEAKIKNIYLLEEAAKLFKK